MGGFPGKSHVPMCNWKSLDLLIENILTNELTKKLRRLNFLGE